MKPFLILFFLFINTNLLFSQESNIINKLKKDSIIKNKYNKSKIHLGGGTGANMSVFSQSTFKGIRLTMWSVSHLIEIGYFIDNNKLVLIKSDIGFASYPYKDQEPVDAWNFGSMHTLAYRQYIFPNKISFFAEAGVFYTNFYSEREVFTELPPKWFHIGGIYAGGGVSFFLFNKVDVSPYVNYNYPIQYKDEAIQYDVFKIITGVNQGISISITF